MQTMYHTRHYEFSLHSNLSVCCITHYVYETIISLTQTTLNIIESTHNRQTEIYLSQTNKIFIFSTS